MTRPDSLSLLACQGCALFQAPPEVQVLRPAAGREINHYQRKMGAVAVSTTKAYEKSETTRLKDDHWAEIKRFHAAHPEQFTPAYVKAQTIILMGKLARVEESADGVKNKIREIDIHLQRAVQILDLFGEWMETGWSKGDVEAVKSFFEEASEKWLKLEKDKALLELESEVKKLEDLLRSRNEEEE